MMAPLWHKRPRLCLAAKSVVIKSKGFSILVLLTVMNKICNIFLKQHQRGRWRYLSLFAKSVGVRFPAPTIAHASQRVPNFTKKYFKN